MSARLLSPPIRTRPSTDADRGRGTVARTTVDAAGADARRLVGATAPMLLAAVALDLVLTRVIVRLAIFVPKGEPWASLGAALGRVGAVADVLVPIVALIVLGALALEAGRGTRLDRVLVAVTAVVAAAGIALVVASPPPFVSAALDALIATVAIGAVIGWRPPASVPFAARSGIALLAIAIAASAVGRWAVVGPSAVVVAHAAFVGGVVVLGAAGLMVASKIGSGRQRAAAIGTGLVVTAIILAAGVRSPAHTEQLLIWSVGLAGVVPLPVVALAGGLAVAGIPVLHARTPQVAVGGSIIILAGSGLAASGLVLASLVGLLVARCDGPRTMEWRSSR